MIIDKDFDKSIYMILKYDSENRKEILELLKSLPKDFLNEVRSMIYMNDHIKLGEEIKDIDKMNFMRLANLDNKLIRISPFYTINSDIIDGKYYSATYEYNHLDIREFIYTKKDYENYLKILRLFKLGEKRIGRFENNYKIESIKDEYGNLTQKGGLLEIQTNDNYKYRVEDGYFIKEYYSNSYHDKKEGKIEKIEIDNDMPKELILK